MVNYQLRPASESAKKWVTKLSESAYVFGHDLTCDVEIKMMEFLSARELAKLAQLSRRGNEIAMMVCRERLIHFVGVKDEEHLDHLPLVEHFCRTKGGLTRLLHLLYMNRFELANSMSTGEGHTCIMKGDTAYTFGDGAEGQLGTGRFENCILPTSIPIPHEMKIRKVMAGSKHTFVLTQDGRLFSFGCNDEGQLGHSGRKNCAEPKQVAIRNVVFTQVTAGNKFTAALTSDGRVAVFGNIGVEVELIKNVWLTRGEMAQDEVITMIASGSFHLLLLTNKNNIYAIGEGKYGKLGIQGNLVPHPIEQHLDDPTMLREAIEARIDRGCTRPCIVKVPTTSEIVQVEGGGNHSACVTSNGDLFMWGCGSNGETGMRKFVRSVPEPTRVELPVESPYALQVNLGKAHTAVLTTTGQLVTFGSRSFKQDGKHSAFFATHTAQPICQGDLAHQSAEIAHVRCGGRHTALFDTNGNLFMFGDVFCCGTPLRQLDPSSSHLPKQVHLNQQHTFVRHHSI